MNSIQLIGRLTRDPELSETRGGTSVVKLRLAVPRRMRDGQEQPPVYVDVSVYGPQAEGVAVCTAKGTLVGVYGRLEFAEWRTNGQLHSRHEVIAHHVFLTPPRPSEADTDEPANVA